MRVLFIGNSHTYFNDMPKTFQEIMGQLTGEEPEVVMLAYSYKDLAWHMKSEYFAVRFNLMYGGYDYCVMQQGAHPFPGDMTTNENVMRISELCRKFGTKPVLIQTWAERDFPEHQTKLTMANARAARMARAILAPVGTIWKKFREEEPDIDLFNYDGEHVGVYGALLEAATVARVICRDMGVEKDLKGIPVTVRKFTGEEEIDYEAPVVKEDPAEVVAEADDETVKKVIGAVEAFMEREKEMLG